MNIPAIRAEQPDDAPAIARLIAAAFDGHPHSDGSEPLIVARLRAAGALAISLVAEDEGIVGHVAFSPITIADGTAGWYGLGPVAVAPERQRHGIGGSLIRAGIADLRRGGACGCVVLGEPAYYARFGFRHEPGLALPGPPPEYFQALRWSGRDPVGRVSYQPAFDG